MSTPQNRYRMWLNVSLPDPDEPARECPSCGFDSLLRFPLTALSERGVSSFGHYVACPRCYELDSEVTP